MKPKAKPMKPVIPRGLYCVKNGHNVYYSASIEVQSIAVSIFICVSVCLYLYLRNCMSELYCRVTAVFDGTSRFSANLSRVPLD